MQPKLFDKFSKFCEFCVLNWFAKKNDMWGKARKRSFEQTQHFISEFSCQDLTRILQDSWIFFQESYQDFARSWKIIQEIQDSYQGIHECRRPARKSTVYLPDFCRNFQDAVPDFPDFFWIFEDHSEPLRIASWSTKFAIFPILSKFSGCSPRFSRIFHDHSRSLMIVSWSPESAIFPMLWEFSGCSPRFSRIFQDPLRLLFEVLTLHKFK